MSLFEALFLKHPRGVGETYFEHAGNALRFAWRFQCCACQCLISTVFRTKMLCACERTVAAMQYMIQSRGRCYRKCEQEERKRIEEAIMDKAYDRKTSRLERLKMALLFQICALCVVAHSIIPALFEKLASTAVQKFHQEIFGKTSIIKE